MNEKTPIKVETIKLIYTALMPTYYKLNALLDDVVSGVYTLSEVDKSALLEQCSMSIALKCIFEEYFSEAEETGSKVLYLDSNQFTTILSLSKGVELAEKSVYKFTGLWRH